MKKKVTAIALAVCILAVAVIGATMAYFTDTDSKTNTFTFGKVDIDLTEDSTDANGAVKGVISTGGGITYPGVLPGLVYSKVPTVKLADNSLPAYVVITATIPTIYDWEGLFNYKIDSAFDWDKKTVGENTIYYFYAKETLDEDAGRTSVTPFTEVKINPALTQEQLGINATFDMVINAYAIQTDGFNGPMAAFWAAFGTPADVTATAADIANVLGTADAGKTVALSENVTLTDTLTANANITINGAGNTITGNAGTNGKSALVLADGGTVKDLNVTCDTIEAPTSNKYGIEAKGDDVTVENSNIKYARAVFADNMAGKTLTIKNSTLNGTYAMNTGSNAPENIVVSDTKLYGWTSYDISGSASFTNCEFGKGETGYAVLKPYDNTTLTDCVFSAEYLDAANNDQYGFDVGAAGFTVNFNNCYVMQNGVKTPLSATLLKQMFNKDAGNYQACTWNINGTLVSFN
mgnify:FL=1